MQPKKKTKCDRSYSLSHLDPLVSLNAVFSSQIWQNEPCEFLRVLHTPFVQGGEVVQKFGLFLKGFPADVGSHAGNKWVIGIQFKIPFEGDGAKALKLRKFFPHTVAESTFHAKKSAGGGGKSFAETNGVYLVL
jgi:hypothetical protein